MAIKFANNARSTLAAGVNASATTMVLAPATGGRFPSLGAGDFFIITVYQPSGVNEIVKVTARNGDSLTVVRAQEGTTALTFAAGAFVSHQPTAGQLETLTNAETAVRLTTPRLIGGVSFDGTADINLPGVNIAGNQNTSGNATTATRFQTARTINGVSFNGTANITAPTNNTADNASTATHFVSFSASSATGNNGSKVSTKLTFQPSTGNFTASGNVTAFSDEKLKADWAEHADDIIERIALVKNGTYKRLDTGEVQTGVSAQSLREVLPEAVVGGETLSVAYGNAALTLVVEMAKKIVQLEARLAELETK